MVKFRAVTEADRHEIDLWIADDPGHAGKMTSDFFVTPGRFHSLYAVEDQLGTVMYVRQEREAKKTRMHIQFGPDRRRITRALREGLPQVIHDARKREFKALVFDSDSPALVKFLMSEFGFRSECEVAL